LIENDGMGFVFDYDPLITKIESLSRERHYHTQEYLLTRIVEACAKYTEIEGVTLNLRKTPVLNNGALGVEISVDKEYLEMARRSL
jgi:dihydroneopterin aldolase